jgi:UrcA family protein
MFYGKALLICASRLVAAAGIGAVAAPVDARPSDPVFVTAEQSDYVTRRVSYADLNLASASGQRSLHGRVRGAVRGVCTEVTGGGATSIYLRDYARCSTEAWGGARPQITRAIKRAQDIALTGSSTIASTAITITFAH